MRTTLFQTLLRDTVRKLEVRIAAVLPAAKECILFALRETGAPGAPVDGTPRAVSTSVSRAALTQGRIVPMDHLLEALIYEFGKDGMRLEAKTLGKGDAYEFTVSELT